MNNMTTFLDIPKYSNAIRNQTGRYQKNKLSNVGKKIAFSTTDAHFYISLLQSGSIPKVGKKQHLMSSLGKQHISLSEHTTADAIRETPQPQTLGKRRLPKHAHLRQHGPQKQSSHWHQEGDVWCNKNLQTDKISMKDGHQNGLKFMSHVLVLVSFDF